MLILMHTTLNVFLFGVPQRQISDRSTASFTPDFSKILYEL
jgi:hypothetical protein